MHTRLQELETKILAHVAEMQGKSAREAAAFLGRTLQKEGVVGVTEEVRSKVLPTPEILLSSLGPVDLDSFSHVLGYK